MTREGAYDSLHEVLNMKSTQQISCTVDIWIPEEELPPRAGLKVIRRNDPDYDLTEDEIRDRNEFIRCYLLSHFKLLTMIPRQDTEHDFFIVDCDVNDPEYSAFNTVDYQRQMRPFNKYFYAIKKMLERVKDLAILHSSITDEEGRLEVCQRYQAFVNRKFRIRLLTVIKRYNSTQNEEHRFKMKQQIAELNYRILDCKRIWERYAPPENWDC